MNTKPMQLKLIALVFGFFSALAIIASIIVVAVPLCQSMECSAAVLIAGWTAATMVLAVMLGGLTLVMRTAMLVAVATFMRGRHAFRLLPASMTASASRAYVEWAFEHKGAPQMGMYIGRLQIVLFGTPVPYSRVA